MGRCSRTWPRSATHKSRQPEGEGICNHGDIQIMVLMNFKRCPSFPCPAHLQSQQSPVLLAPYAPFHHVPHCQRIGRCTEPGQVVFEGAGRGGEGGGGEGGRRVTDG